MQKNSFLLALPVLALAALTACGGGGNKTTTTTTTSATAAVSPGAMNAGAGSMSGAMANATIAPVPAGLNCGATKPVWVNPRRHVFHTATDPYYGRTKRGEYMCVQTAMAKGYHAAFIRGGGMMANPRHRKGSMGGSMSGAAAASPAPSPT